MEEDLATPQPSHVNKLDSISAIQLQEAVTEKIGK